MCLCQSKSPAYPDKLMQFSLRTLIIACTVTGVFVGWAAREYRRSIPGSFPVTYSTTQILDVDVPEKVLVWRKPSVWRATIAAEKATDLEVRKYQPTDEDVLAKVLSNPAEIHHIGEQERRVITANREQVLLKAPQWLSKRTDHSTLIGAAHVLAVLDDRRAFDLAIKRLPQMIKDPGGSILVQKLACTHPTDWAVASPEIMAAARDAFDQTPIYSLAWVLEKSGDKTAMLHYYRTKAKTKEPFYYHTPALKWLTENAPGEEVFQQVMQHFKSPDILSGHDSPELLELYLKSENPRWRSEAFDLAMQLTNTPPSKRGGYHVYPYERLIFAHGGDDYMDYFKRHVEQQKCQFAMRGLGRLLPRQEHLSMLREKKFYSLYLEEEGDAAIPFLLERNMIDLVVDHQAGTKDPVTAAAIRKLLAAERDFFKGLNLINALEKLGVAVDRNKLMDGLNPPAPFDPTEPYQTRTHWLVNRITNDDFLKFVSQYAAKSRGTTRTPVPVQQSSTAQQVSTAQQFPTSQQFSTAKQVFDDLGIPKDERDVGRLNACKLMAATGIAKEFIVNDYGFDQVGLVAREMSSLIADDLPFESVGFENPHLRFAAKHHVFEVALLESHSWYDPVAIADVLNSILDKHSKSPKRLYCFDMEYDWSYVTIAYLDESFVTELGETYAVYPYEAKRVRQKPVSKLPASP